MPGSRIELEGVSKSFGSTRALRDVSLALRGGEVLAVVGANGAGKSTLNKLLAGVLTPDTGTVSIDGAPVRFESPLEAREAGIETVHQHASEWTVPGMSAAENLLLDRFASGEGGGWMSPRSLVGRAAEVAEALGLELSRSALADDVTRLSVSERQLIALARALARSPRLLVLDEPTSALAAAEAERLFGIVRRLRERGVAILYVSHRLGEVEALADRVAVLRDGRLEAEFPRPFETAKVVHAMLGEVADDIESVTRRDGGATVVRLEGARVFADSEPFDLELRGGEVLGLTGLIGAGKSELLGALFGLRPLAGGTILLDGEALAPADPAEAIGRGVHLVPEDRAGQSLIPLWSVRANATLAVLKRFVRRGLTRVRDEQRGTEGMIHRLGVVCSGPEAPIESLSGGNQQKVALGRWLFKPARVLLLDEPFRGVDLGARRDIADRLRELEGDGAVVVASADVDEVLEVADRIVVLAEGTVVQDVRAGAADRGELTLAMNGAA
jgi:simple sugar transport system ATP-binding protein